MHLDCRQQTVGSLLCVVLWANLGACMVGPSYSEPEASVNTAWIEQGDPRISTDPAGALPDASQEIRTLRGLLAAGQGSGESVTARSRALILVGHYHAVASELAECRDRYDAIDWATWDRDRF